MFAFVLPYLLLRKFQIDASRCSGNAVNVALDANGRADVPKKSSCGGAWVSSLSGGRSQGNIIGESIGNQVFLGEMIGKSTESHRKNIETRSAIWGPLLWSIYGKDMLKSSVK